MTILHVGSSTADFNTVVAADGTTGSEVVASCSEGVRFGPGDGNMVIDVATSSEMWVAFTLYRRGSSTDFVQFIDQSWNTSTGGLQIDISSDVEADAAISSTLVTNLGSGGTVNEDTRIRFDIQLIWDNSSGIVNVWLDGTQVINFTGDTIRQSYSGVDRILFQHRPTSVSTNADSIISGIIISTQDTRDYTLVQAPIDGAGGETDFGGAFTDIDDVGNDTNNFITSNTNGDRATFTTDYPSAYTSGYQVVASVVSFSARAFDTPAVTQCAPVNRIGGTSYDGSTVTTPTNYGVVQEVFSVNPADSSAWDISDLQSLEVGVKAIT